MNKLKALELKALPNGHAVNPKEVDDALKGKGTGD